MNKDKKNLIIIGAIVLIIIVVVVLIFVFAGNKDNGASASASGTPSVSAPANTSDKTNVNVSGDGTKVNNSSKLAEEKVFQGMKINDIKLTSKNGGTQFTAKVSNNTGSDIEGQPVVIFFFDKDGTQISTLEAYIAKIKNGGSTEIDASSTSDLSNAYNFTVNAK